MKSSPFFLSKFNYVELWQTNLRDSVMLIYEEKVELIPKPTYFNMEEKLILAMFPPVVARCTGYFRHSRPQNIALLFSFVTAPSVLDKSLVSTPPTSPNWKAN